MKAPLVTLMQDGRPVPAGGTIPVVPGHTVSLRICPDSNGWPVFANAPRTPFLTLLLEGAGLMVDGAVLDGQALQTFAVPFDQSGHAMHPLTHGIGGAQMVSGPPGGTLVAVRLPYGLTVPGVHPDIVVQLGLAADAAPDARLRVLVAVPDGADAIAATSLITISPAAVTLETTVGTPEQETVIGAVEEVTVRAHVAAGVTGVIVQATLPSGAAFVGAALLGGNGITSFNEQTGIVTGQFTQLGSDARMVVRFYALGAGLLEGTSRAAVVKLGQAAVFPPDGPGWALTAKPVALRSGVSAVDTPAPGRQLEWKLTGTVSPAGASGLRITDTLGNGQRFDTGFAPRLTVSRGGVPVLSNGIAPTITAHADGTSTLEFDVSEAATGVWSLAGSMIEVVFRSTINQLFEGPQAAQLVGQGDRLDNAAVLQAIVRGAAVSDATTAGLTLPGSSLQFSIYAVNGQVVSGPVHAAIGDAVTYRVQATLPLTTARGFTVLAAGPGPLGAMVFDGAMGGIPRAGNAQFGPSGSYTANAPAVQAMADGTVRFDFGHVLPVYGNGSGTLDLLYTARLDSTASDPGAPEAQAWLQERSTAGAVHQGYAAATLVLEQPVLRLQTASLYASNDAATWTGTGGPFGYSPFTGQFGGTITSAGLAAEPFRDVLFNVDAGDEVTFVIAVESMSAGPAFGVVLHNSLPAGFTAPAWGADVVVMDGDGNLLGSSGNLFDPAVGLTLNAPVPGYDAQSGLNVVLVTFTLQTQHAMPVPARTDSVARLLAYRAEPGAANLVTHQDGTTASTGIVTVQPAVSIALASTSAARTAGSALAPGETATLAITITLPEGQVGALTLDHLLPDGFEFVSAEVKQVGGNLSVSAGAVRDGYGFRFGVVTNTADNQVTDADRIQVQLVARARSMPAGPVRLTAVLGASEPGGPVRWSGSDYTDLSVAAPSLLLQATAPTTAQAGEVGTFMLRLSNAPGAETAFNVRLADVLASGLSLMSGSLSTSGAASAATVMEAGGTVTANLSRLEPGETLTVTFQARILDGAATGGILSSAATVTAAALGITDLIANAVQIRADAATRIVAPTVSVALVGRSGLAVGDVAAYRIIATVPEGISPGVVLRSVLPAGLVYVAGSARVMGVGAALPGLVAPGIQVNQQQVRLDFGRVDATAGDRSIIVELLASVSGVTPLGPSLINVLLQTGYTTAAGSAAATVANTPPMLSGLPAVQVTPDNAAIPLFAGLMLTDPDGGQVQTIRITLSDPANGSLAGADLDTPGTYRITGTTVAANAALAGLRFIPVPHRAALSEMVRTTVTVDVQDPAGGRASATTTLAATTTNTVPVIDGAVAGQSTPARVAALPFATLTLRDRDPGQVSALTIWISDPARGRLVPPGSGSLDTSGVFHMTGLLPDLQAAARALAYIPSTAASNATVQFGVTLDDGAGGTVSNLATTMRVVASVDTIGVAQHFGLSPDADFITFASGQQTVVRGEVYEGPVTYLRSQLIYDSSDSVVIVAKSPSVFVKSFSGFAAIQVSSGQNVVDAGPGSNFIVGGSGNDTFFLDGNLGQVVWNTISGFTPGDAVTIFGWRPGVSTYSWENGAGAAGYTGRTLRADLRGEGQTSGSLTFVGSVQADTDRYTISEGQVAGFNYLSISSLR